MNDTDRISGGVGAEARLNGTNANTTVIPRIKHELHIGGFFDLNSRNGAGALSAALLAVEEINQDSRYLKDYRIVLHHQRSTKGELSEGTSILYHYLSTEPKKLMLLGPFDNNLAKTVAAYAGLPEIGILQFSYGATDLALTTEKTQYPLFFRTVPTEIVFNEPCLQFIQHFGWKDEIGLIYNASPYYSQISKELAKSLRNNGTKIVANEGFTQDPAVAVKILKEKEAHIIIGTFHHTRAKEVFCQAYLNGMYGKDYVWIVTSTPDVNSTFDWWVPEPSSSLPCTREEMEEALDHHFTFYYKNKINGTLVSGKTTDQFFTEYSQNIPSFFRSTYAPFAYEAMWAIAATLERGRPVLNDWEMDLHDLGYDRRMVSELFKEEAFEVKFTGPSGQVAFDENGNRQCKVFIQQFRKSVGAREVGVFDYNPPTLTLKGSSQGSGTPETLEYVHWPAGLPYRRKVSSDSWLYILFPLFIGWTLISGFLLVCCVLCYALLLVFRRHRVIYHSGFYLTQLLLVGCMLSLFSVVLFGIDGALVSFESLQLVCKARSWFLSLGFTLCLGSVLPRVLYAYRVVSWRPETIRKVPWAWMHMIAFFIFIGDVILLITWQIVFKPRAVKVLREVAKPRPYQEEPQLIEQCVSNNEEAALALLLVPKGILLITGAIAAWPARRLCLPLCNNTRNCALCLGIATVMCIIEAPIIMTVRQYPNPFYAVTGLLIMVLSAALLVIGVLPQLKRAHRCKKKALMASQECNDIEMTQDGNGGRCDCNACNDHKTFRPHLAACTGPYSCAPVSQEWDYMVSKVPNRTKEGEPRIVTETVYVDAPTVPTAVAETQTLKVIYSTAEIQTLVVRTQSASILTEPEPEIEQADVMLQTEAEEPTPVVDANTQTINVTITEKDVQTEKTATISTHIQTEGTKNSHAQVQTDEPPPPPDILSEESDTASVASSITTSPKPERKARKKKVFNVQPKIDTNLSPRRKELVAKSSPITKPTLRVPTTLHNSRSRENLSLSPRSREPSPARGGNR